MLDEVQVLRVETPDMTSLRIQVISPESIVVAKRRKQALGAGDYVAAVIIIADVLNELGVVNERITLPAAFEIEVVKRQTPLMRNHQIGVFGKEMRRDNPADETRFLRADDIELPHQGTRENCHLRASGEEPLATRL